jgi:hypothetical protein
MLALWKQLLSSQPESNPKSKRKRKRKSKSKSKLRSTKRMSYTGPTRHELLYQIFKHNYANPNEHIPLVPNLLSEVDKAKIKSLESHEKLMRKNYTILQRTTETFMQKLKGIMEMETNDQALALNWDLFIQEAEIMVKLLKDGKKEIEEEVQRRAEEAKVESRQQFNELSGKNNKPLATFSFLGAFTDAELAERLQKEEIEFQRVRKVRHKISVSNMQPEQGHNQVR